MVGGRRCVAESGFDASQMVFGAVPVPLIRPTQNKPEQTPRFVQLANGFKIGSMTINCNRTGVIACWFYTANILEAFKDAVEEIMTADMDVQFGSPIGKA